MVKSHDTTKIIPEELLPAVKHLRKSFDEMHWNFGYTTELLCFWKLHGEQAKRGTKNFQEYLEFLPALKERAGPAANAAI